MSDAPKRKPAQDKLEMIRQLRQDELDRLNASMKAFPGRTPDVPITAYERATVLDEVFERLKGGESLPLICSDAHMPARQVVMRWLSEDLELARRYEDGAPARARSLFELALWEVQRACDREAMAVAEKRANVYLRAAALLDPKVYSDKTHGVLAKSGGSGAPIAITLNIGAHAEGASRELVVVDTQSHTDE